MLEELKRDVWEANRQLPKLDLVLFTWGNVSGIDRDRRLVVIKPSGVSYQAMRPDDMVVVDLNGKIIEGDLKPSSDTATHLALYRAFLHIGGIVHTHSTWATIWAQAGSDIPILGTTQADYFSKNVPCTRDMTQDEIEHDYETHTGDTIVERFHSTGLDPMDVPAVLVKAHGPFAWGQNLGEAVHNAKVLEAVAMMAWHTVVLAKEAPVMNEALARKHFERKHGPNAYYGQ